VLDPAEDAVEVRAAHRALGLGHPGALVVDVHLARGLALRLALHAVELAAVRLRHDFLLVSLFVRTLVTAAGPCATLPTVEQPQLGATVTATNARPLGRP